MNSTHDFIIIDDDPVNNFISREMIGLAFSKSDNVVDFTSPEKGLEHITTAYNAYAGNPVALLLDINMPTMSGWEFLENFNRLEEKIRNIFSVFIVSSSVDPRDKKLALENYHIRGFVTKPVNEEFLVNRFGKNTSNSN